MTRTETPWGTWEPATLSDVAELFSTTRIPWWIAGGYAIELAVGHNFREHSDIDVLLLRRDQLVIQELLPTWEWWAADPPGTLRSWHTDETLPVGVHDIWCRPSASEPWQIQFMLDEAEDQDWISRRSSQLRRPVEFLGLHSPEGVPYVAPEVQLFYKAHQARPKDEQDFAAALQVLTDDQRRWLADAIGLVYGDHPWSGRLRR